MVDATGRGSRLHGAISSPLRVRVKLTGSHGVTASPSMEQRRWESIGTFQQPTSVAPKTPGAGLHGDDRLKVAGVVLLIGDLAAVAVEITLARAPAGAPWGLTHVARGFPFACSTLTPA